MKDIRRDTTDRMYDTIQKRNLSFAFTMFYYVISFCITFYLNFIYLFKSSHYFVPRFVFVVIISTTIYLFMVKHFIKFLSRTEVGEDLDLTNSTAVIVSMAVFVLETLIMFLLFIIFLYFIGTIIGGIFSGDYSSIHNFT